MGISASFEAIAGLPPERRLKLVEAALLDGHPPLHTAAFALLADPAGLNRPDILVARYSALPQELRQRMSHQKDRFLPAARALLESEREGDRRAGLAALFALDPYDAVPGLCRLLDDPAPIVRDNAAARLRELGERYYFHLVAARNFNDPESRGYLDGYAPRMLVLFPHVFRAFPKHGLRVFLDIAVESGPDAYPVLVDQLLVRGAAPVRQAFLDALRDSATEPAVRLLFRLHAERVGRLRATAAEVLRRRADASFASLVAATLGRMDSEEALSVAKSQAELPWWPEPEAVAEIDAPSASRLLDFAALSSLPPRRRDELLLRFRRSPHAVTRVKVLSLLQVLEHPDFPRLAEEALNDPDDEVKAAGARALVGLNPPHKAKLLLPLLNSTSDELRRFAMREVASAGVERYLAASERLDARTRETAVRALAKIDPRIVDRLLEEVVSRDPLRRMASLRAVHALDAEPVARERLLPLLADPDRRVRATAVRVVKGGVERLLEALRDPDARVRANAVESLEESGDARAVEALMPLLADPAPRARANAALALARLGRDEGRRTLEAMAKDPDPGARISAIWALGRLRGTEAFLRELGESETDPVVRGRLAESILITEAR